MSDEVVLKKEDIEQQEKVGANILRDAELITVSDSSEYGVAQEFRREIKRSIEAVLAKVNPVVEAAFAAHKAATGLRAQLTANLQKADALLDGKQKAFVRAQREAEEKLKAQQLAEAKKLEDQRRQELAEELKKAGEPEQAKEVLAAPVEVFVPVAPSLIPKGVRQLWKVKSVDILVLAQWVLDNPIMSHFLEAEVSKLRSHKIDNPKAEIPGVEFILDDSITVKK